MKIDLIPCLSDNYAVLLYDGDNTLLVDAPESAPIEKALEKAGRRLTHILITHHHSDHINGIEALKNKYSAKVYANKADSHRIPHVDIWFKPQEVLTIGKLNFQIIDTPGHTVGHVVFYEEKQKLLFAGDTLFSAGCGRLFEGGYEEFYKAISFLKTLPDDVQLYCGHEYTLSNLKFAFGLEPNNKALQSALLTRDEFHGFTPSIPSLLSFEKQVNPYFRLDQKEIREKFGLIGASDLAVFQELRERKNRF